MEENVTREMEEEQIQKEQAAEVKVENAKKPKGWKAIVAGFFITVLFLVIQSIVSVLGTSIVTVGIMAEYDVSTITQEELTNLLLDSGAMTVMLFFAILITGIVALIWYKAGYVKKYTKENRMELKEKAGNVKIIGSLILAGIGCYSLAILIASVIALISPAAMDNFNNMMSSATGGNAVLSFLTVVILAPIAEEVIFRGIIFRKLLITNSAKVAIIAQALLFAFYHFNIVQGIYVLPIALVLGYTAYKFNSVLPCILIHAMNNLMPTFVSLLPEALQSVAVFAALAVICIVAIYLINKERQEKAC